MAVAYVSSTTLVGGTRTNSTLTAPSSITNGNLLLLCLSTGVAGGVTPTPPSGFAAITGSPLEIMVLPDTWRTRLNVWWKIAASESGSYATSHASAYSEGIIVNWSGNHTTTPINPTPSTNNGTGSTTTALGITTATDNSGVVFASVAWDGQGGAAPTGSTPTFTERWDGGSAGALYVATGVLATAAATGNKTNTNNNLTANTWGAFLIGIAEASGVVTGRPLTRRPWRFFRRRR